MSTHEICSACFGEGKVREHPYHNGYIRCPECYGTGNLGRWIVQSVATQAGEDDGDWINRVVPANDPEDAVSMTIGINNFVRRQTVTSEFTHFEGPLELVVDLAEEHFAKAKPGYRNGVCLVPVPPQGFRTSVVVLSEGDKLVGEYKSPKVCSKAPSLRGKVPVCWGEYCPVSLGCSGRESGELHRLRLGNRFDQWSHHH